MKIFKDSLKILTLVLIVCLAYRLNFIAVLICIIFAGVFNVAYLKEEKRRKYYLEKFKSLVTYMEQMMYSFKKQPKIMPALRDAAKVSSGEMKEIIEEVITCIDSGMNENIYEDSLGLIEEEYNCKRVKSLHKFLIKLELHGGMYENYLDILLEDIRQWSDATLMFIKDVDRAKRNVLISIISTMITCGFMAYLVPSDYQFTAHPVYQICSTVVIVLMMGAYLLVIKKLNFNWISEKSSLPEKMIIKYYFLVEKAYKNYGSLKPLEKLSYKKAKKRLEREISKEFPDWIRDVAINLQNDTVQSAIEKSYENTPFVLKRPIRKLLIDFEKYPVGIEPYDNLLKEFDLSDITSSVKMFYSINELGAEESEQQLNAIIDRNNKLMRQAEEMRNKDSIGLASLYTALPMLIGVVKIMIDMILMILVFTSSLSNVIGGV